MYIQLRIVNYDWYHDKNTEVLSLDEVVWIRPGLLRLSHRLVLVRTIENQETCVQNRATLLQLLMPYAFRHTVCQAVDLWADNFAS